MLLASGSALNGLLAYVFFVLASRSLGAEDAAPVSVLWSYWAAGGAVLTFPVQHWIIRRLTADGHEGTVRRSLPRLSAIVVALAVVAGLVAFLVREPLFGSDGVAFPAMVAAVTVGSFLMGVVRGALSGRGRFAATAASLVAENALRVVGGAVVIWLGGGAVAFGVAMILGPLVSLAWGRSLRFRLPPSGAAVVRNPLALVSGIAGGSLTAQVVLAGSPVLLAALGGAPADVTSLFLALAVWRAPYLVALGVTPQITTVLTRMAIEGPARRVARAGRATALLVVAGSAVAVLLGATILQPVLRAVFGSDVQLAGSALAALGAGTVAALGNLVLLLMLLALGRSRAASLVWGAAVLLAAGWLVVADVGLVTGVVVAFVVAEAAAFLLMLAAVEAAALRVARQGLGSRGTGECL